MTTANVGGSATADTSTGGGDGSGGSANAGTTSGAQSGATTTTTGAGGTGGSGAGGSTGGSDASATGSSGGSPSTNVTSTTTTAGGVGGAPDHSCREDAECGLATNVAECCPGCAAAYLKNVIASDPCLIAKGENDSGKCETPVCTDVACPTIACHEAVYAACEDGHCVAKTECPEGTILDRGSCVPPCKTQADCVVATRSGECCGGCPDAYHRQAVEADPCLVPLGKPAPEVCSPDPEECALILCPAVLCVEPGSPMCGEQGVCAMTLGLTE